jgi:hypothetical protein
LKIFPSPEYPQIHTHYDWNLHFSGPRSLCLRVEFTR